jgi:hypothetical protein
MVDSVVNRERCTQLAIAACAAALCSTPVLGKDAPKPKLSLDPVVARTLLAPVDEASTAVAGYRLDPGIEPARGQRARLSVDVGQSTLFAITGRLNRQPGPPGPLSRADAKALGLRSGDSGKVYGAGISRNIGGVDVSATYQYSKISAEHPGDDAQARDGGPGRSHSLRATARIRFGR